MSADVGPDLIVPWRRPSMVIVSAEHAIDPADLELVEAQGTHGANVIVRVPEDRSVFAPSAFIAEVGGSDVSLADPAQMIWEGLTASRPREGFREWLLTRP